MVEMFTPKLQKCYKFVQEKQSNIALYPTVVALSRYKVLHVGQL